MHMSCYSYKALWFGSTLYFGVETSYRVLLLSNLLAGGGNGRWAGHAGQPDHEAQRAEDAQDR